MDHVAKSGERRARLDCEDELAQDLARARGHQCRADQDFAPPVTDELDHSAVEVVDVATGGLSGVGRGGHDVKAPLPSCGL